MPLGNIIFLPTIKNLCISGRSVENNLLGGNLFKRDTKFNRKPFKIM